MPVPFDADSRDAVASVAEGEQRGSLGKTSPEGGGGPETGETGKEARPEEEDCTTR